MGLISGKQALTYGKVIFVKELDSSLLERITDAFIAVDAGWHFTYVNLKAAEILGRDRYELLGKHWWTEVPEGTGSPFYKAYHQAMVEQQPIQMEQYSEHLGRWFENRIYPSPTGLTIFFTDITERKQEERRMSAAAMRLEALIANLQASIVVEDSEGQIVLVNQAFCDLNNIDAPAAALIGSNFSFIVQRSRHVFANPNTCLATLRFLRHQQQPVQGAEMLLADGRTLECDYSPVFPGGDGEKYGGHLWQIRDVTERRRAEQQIKEAAVILEAQKGELERANQQLEHANAELEALATTDGLTGLRNHRVFMERLREEFRRARRYEEPLSLMMLDVDHFKTYNDAFGHVKGNGALRKLAAVLQEVSRETDVVARYGGEEFAVILPHTVATEAQGVAERMRAAVEAHPWEHRPITASFGVAELTETMADPKALVSDADAAMYRSKSAGRNRVT